MIAGLVPLLVIGLIAYRGASNALTRNAEVKLQDVSFTTADTLDRNLFERYGDVQAFALSAPARSMDPARITEWIDAMMGIYTPIYNLMVVADANGRVIAVNGVDITGDSIQGATRRLLGRDVSGSDWFKNAISRSWKAGTTLVEDVHGDDLTSAVFGADSPQSRAMSFTYPIRDDAGKIVGVWTNRFNWDVTSAVIDSVRERAVATGAGSLNITMLGREGTVIASTDAGVQPFTASATGNSLATAALSSKEGTARGSQIATGGSVFGGFARSSGFETYPGVGWTFLATESSDEALSAVTSLRRSMLLSGVAILALLGAAAWFLGRGFARPLAALRDKMRHIGASGDLTARVDAARGDEIGQVGAAFNEMIGEFEQIIAEVGTNSNSLSSSAEEMASAAGAARSAVSEIASTMDHVATGASDQAHSSQRASATVDQIGSDVGQVAERSQSAAEAAGEADTAAQEGSETLSEAARAMDEIRESVVRAGEVVAGLGRHSEAIGAIVGTISDISAQTNLLALNAAIEAARAGEAGKGFAVVAEEVRKLAESSQESASSISGIIEEIQTEARRAVAAMEDGTGAVEGGSERMSAAADAFDAIRERVAHVSDEVAQVASAAVQLRSGADSALDAVGAVAAVSEENAAAAQQVSASTEESAASVELVSSVAGRVAESAGTLDRLVSRFEAGSRITG